jgi:hypothetical protein
LPNAFTVGGAQLDEFMIFPLAKAEKKKDCWHQPGMEV